MINKTRAIKTLRTHLTNVRELEDDVWRGIREYGGNPYAAYYVDLSGNPAKRAASLQVFQDTTIGQWYFGEKNDLRWNSYMFLLASEKDLKLEATRAARQILESDRNYARKFVIPEQDLNDRLAAGLAQDEMTASMPIDVVQDWRSSLTKVGLISIFGDAPIAKIVRSVVDGLPLGNSSSPVISTPRPSDSIQSGPIRSIHLKNFRPYPLQRTFDFGAVNLIRGSNGVGKTTLLEAIEFLYCGRNLRSPAPMNAVIEANVGGRQYKTTAKDRDQVFRDRNLLWYGKHDLRTVSIEDSFATFTLLNTAAAFQLSTSNDPTSFDSALADLLVGSDASRVWDRIQRVHNDLQPRRNALQAQVDMDRSSIKASEERLAVAKAVENRSDDFYKILARDLETLGWRSSHDTKTGAASATRLNLVGIEALLTSVVSLPDLPEPPTISSIQEGLAAVSGVIERVSAIASQLKIIEAQRQEHSATLKAQGERKEELQELLKYVTADYQDLISTHATLTSRVGQLTSVLEDLDSRQLKPVRSIDTPSTLDKIEGDLNGSLLSTAEAVRTTLEELEMFKGTQSRILSLAQELRGIGLELLETTGEQDVCPLCHTAFEPGELQGHIMREVNSRSETHARKLQQSVEDARKKYQQTDLQVQLIKRLAAYCYRKKWDKRKLTLPQVLKGIEDDEIELRACRKQREQRQTRIQSLEADGLTPRRFEALRSGLFAKLTQNVTKQSLSAALAEVLGEQEKLQSALGTIDKRQKAQQVALRAVMKDAGIVGDVDVRAVSKTLHNRRESLERASEVAGQLTQLMTPKGNASLRKLLNSIHSASQTQDQLRKAIAAETNATKVIEEATRELTAAQSKSKSSQVALKRIDTTLKQLRDLISTRSRDIVTKELLNINRKEIAAIFSQVHAPKEFEMNSSDDGLLQRIETKEGVGPNEMSTGQLTAFALSIFLAMNAHASSAPPIMLIDDPVAHIDDLNTLSFLDYLRDLAVTKQRQLFFATADDRLAGLFAHKFSFLGDEFKVHHLLRDPG